MKLYYIITKSQEILEKNYFLPSLLNNTTDIEPKSIFYKPKNENIGNFWDDDYLDTLIFRNNKIIELIDENFGQKIIISDVDILIVKDFINLINFDNNEDIMHMRDGIDGVNIINGGFTIINCNIKTKNFYTHILKKVVDSNNKKYLDQDAIKDYYYKENNPINLNWKYLESSMFAVRYDWKFLEKNKNNLVMFHATNTVPYGNISSLEKKIYYLEMFKKWYYDNGDRFY